MVGERENPRAEGERLQNARDALAVLNSYILGGGSWDEALGVFGAIAREELDRTGDKDAAVHATLRMWQGTMSLAWELLIIRERETGISTSGTLQELGLTFNPPSE